MRGTANAFSIGRAQRPEMAGNNKVPGPGSYHQLSPSETTRNDSMMSKSFPKWKIGTEKQRKDMAGREKSQSPGPG
jgi:hypothetical protein